MADIPTVGELIVMKFWRGWLSTALLLKQLTWLRLSPTRRSCLMNSLPIDWAWFRLWAQTVMRPSGIIGWMFTWCCYILVFNVVWPQECTCLNACNNCAIKLTLNVACNDSQAMDITSNHLDVVDNWESLIHHAEQEPSEEPSNRSENFGHPVGKSAFESFSVSCPYIKSVFGRRPYTSTRPDLQN